MCGGLGVGGGVACLALCHFFDFEIIWHSAMYNGWFCRRQVDVMCGAGLRGRCQFLCYFYGTRP